MNKKLFSWKALAGLALLVAMGMTSCKNNTEVDPNDPYNVKTPTQPSISIKGSADVTITVIASGDLATQWNSLAAATKETLREKSTLNVLVKSGAYKLDGGVLQLPNFFAGAKATTGKVVNVQFDGGFQNADYLNTKKDGKKALTLNTDLLAGNQVNFILPAGNYDVNIETTKTEASLAGADTNIGYFTFKAATDKSATSIKSGVTIKRAVPGTGDIKIAGGALEAKVITATEAQGLWNGAGTGFAVGGQASAYSLYIESGTPIITNVDKENRKIGTVTIAKGAGVTFTEEKPYVTAIVGEDAGCTVTFTDGGIDWGRGGTSTNLDNVGSIEKCKLTLGYQYVLANTVLKNIELVSPAVMSNTNYAEGIKFNTLDLNFDKDDQTATFKSCKFNAAGVTVNGNFSVATKTESTLYEWVVSGTSGSWVAVKDNKTDNLKEYNKNETIQEFTNYVDAATGLYTSTDVDVVGGTLVGNTWKVSSKVIKITVSTNASLVPDNVNIVLNSCDLTLADINDAFKTVFTTTPWYNIVVDGVTLKWKQDTAGTWWLVKP